MRSLVLALILLAAPLALAVPAQASTYCFGPASSQKCFECPDVQGNCVIRCVDGSADCTPDVPPVPDVTQTPTYQWVMAIASNPCEQVWTVWGSPCDPHVGILPCHLEGTKLVCEPI